MVLFENVLDSNFTQMKNYIQQSEIHKITSAIEDVIMSGIGSVVLPTPSLINLACGYF